MTYAKALLAELMRLVLGMVFVIALSLPTIHAFGSTSHSHYGYLCSFTMLFYALVWMGVLRVTHKNLAPHHSAASGLAVLMATAAFLVLIPLSLDRSLSVLLLQEMEQVGDKGARVEQIEGLFIKQYTCGHAAISKRLSEQVIAGNARQLENGSYALTAQGRAFVASLNFLGRSFHIPARSSTCPG